MNAAPPTSPRARTLTFEGGCNFRDIGGYRTHDGRTVRWGKVYRAGVLSYFSSSDHASLRQLGVRAICDLRREEERRREPTRWPDESAHGLSWDDGNAPTIRAFAAKRPNSAAGMRDSMIDLYRVLPTWMAPRIRGLFECASDDRLPVVVHCAAGKDRTGVAIALLLSALGVPRETIIEDYLLTNDVGNFEEFILARQHTQLGLADAHHPLLSMPQDVRRTLFVADADYLQAALDVIDTDLGGVDGFLKSYVRLDAARLEKIRGALLD